MDPAIQQILALAIEAYNVREFEKAKKLFQTVIIASPLDPNPYDFMGLIYIQTNQPGIAVHYFRESIRLNPNNPLHQANLAGAFLQTKQLDEALAASNHALALDADYPAALFSSGVALLLLGRTEESRLRLQRLFVLYPERIELLNELAFGMLQQSAFDEAERMLRLAVSLSPTYINALMNLSLCLLQTSRNKEAMAVCERILEINPKHIATRFFLCFACLHHIYKDEEEIVAARSRYEIELRALHNLCSQSTPAELFLAEFCLGTKQPFLLAYQGEDDRMLQALYGDIIAQFMMACYPEWEKQLPLRTRTSDKRIRVGIVSGFFKYHSNWKAHIRGWVQQINHKDFAIFGYYTGNECNEVTKEARIYLERLTWGLGTLQEYCSIITDDNLDVLIFPEIGMDSMTMRLAALRLAPVQCTTWGNPTTSGLQTMDYFLGSALMEPPDGDAYYTEKLILLPNLSVYYEPLPVPHLKRTRADFGLRENAILYWCCQVPIKYHPRYDEVFAKIAHAVPNAQLVFVESMPDLASQFRARLEGTFAHFGLRASDYCVYLPRLDSKEFDAATHLMDVFLDSIGWSGCNSSLESIGHDLPLVTLPGTTMRSRHTAAIITMMGMKDCIATSLDDYVARAVSLGRHPEERLQMRARIAAQKQLVYRDVSAIVALEDFLKSVSGRTCQF